ncbi:MAG: hypothetical protein R3Y53_03970 [Bacillota bacterium]
MKIKKDMRSMKTLQTIFHEMESNPLRDPFWQTICSKNQPVHGEEVASKNHLVLKKESTPQFDFLIETLIELFHGLSSTKNQGNVSIHETRVYHNTIQKIKNEMQLHQYDHRVQQVNLTLEALLRENFSTNSVEKALPVLETYIKKNTIHKQFSRNENNLMEENAFQTFVETHMNQRIEFMRNSFFDTQLFNEGDAKTYRIDETFIQKLHTKNNIFLPTISYEKNFATNTKNQYHLTGDTNTVYRMEQMGTEISVETQLWLAEQQEQQLHRKSQGNAGKSFYLTNQNTNFQQFFVENPSVFEGAVRSFYERNATHFHEVATQTEKTHAEFYKNTQVKREKSIVSALREIVKMQTVQNNDFHTKTQTRVPEIMQMYTAQFGGATLRELIRGVVPPTLHTRSVIRDGVVQIVEAEAVNRHFNRYVQLPFQKWFTQTHLAKQEKEIFRSTNTFSSTTLVNRLLPQWKEYATLHESNAYFEVAKERLNELRVLQNQLVVQNGIWQTVNRNSLHQKLELTNAIRTEIAIQENQNTQHNHSQIVYVNQEKSAFEKMEPLEQIQITSSMAKYFHMNRNAEITKRVVTSLFYELATQNSFSMLVSKANLLVQNRRNSIDYIQKQVSNRHETSEYTTSHHENHSNSTRFFQDVLHRNFFVNAIEKGNGRATIYENNLYFSKAIPQNEDVAIVEAKMVDTKIVRNTMSQLTNQVITKLHTTLQNPLLTSVIERISLQNGMAETVSHIRNSFWNYAYDMNSNSTISSILQNEFSTQNAYDNRQTRNFYKNNHHQSSIELPLLQMRELQQKTLQHTKEVERQIVHKKETHAIHTIAEIARQNFELIQSHSQKREQLNSHMDFMKLHQTHEILQKTTKQNIVNLYENNHLFNHQKFHIGRASETVLAIDSIEKMHHNRKTSFFHTKQSEVLLHETKTKLEHKITNVMTEKYNEFVVKKEIPPTTLEDIEVELGQFITKTVDEKIAIIKEETDAKQSAQAKQTAEASEKSIETTEVFTELDVERIYERVYTKIERTLESERRRMGH